MTSRRKFLYGMVAAPLALRMRANAATFDNPTYSENQQPGTLNWQIALSGYSRSDDSSLQIKGYASASSVNQGESITFYVTVNPVQMYTIDVYRIGWYGGKGGRLMQQIGPLNGATQPAPTLDSTTGMVVCPWSASYTLNVPTDWTSGIYLALLTNSNNYQTYIIFVVRDDARNADILYQQSVTTYQAYNNYPDNNKTGKNLYDGGSYGAKTTLGTQRAVKVSFDRPYTYTDHTGAGELLHYDIYFIRWLERNGYDVCYSTDIDTHANGSRILNFKTFLSVGHDEYWSKEMYDNVQAARDAGTSLAFFGANPIYNQIRFEKSTLNGAPNRVIVCYKDANLDPVNNPSSGVYNPLLTTVPWRSSPVNRPEQQLVGIMYTSYIDADNPALSYVVQNSSTSSGQKVYAGTGLADGISVPGVLGYEMDRQFTEFPTPDKVPGNTVIPGTYTLLSHSPFTDIYRNSDYANSSIYQVSSGAWVFASGSMYWNWGLDDYVPPPSITTYAVAAPSGPLQAATANILNLLIAGGAPNTLAAPTNLTATATVNAIALSWQDHATTATAYTVERSPDNTNWTVLTSTLPADATSYTDSTVGSWYYRVKATNGTSSSGYSNTISIATIPAGPTNLKAVASSSLLAINLSWTDNATTETAYSVERSDNGATWTVLTSTLPTNTQSYSDASVAPLTAYSYRVKATNASGSSAYSNVASATSPNGPPPPAPPSNLTAKQSGGGNGQKIVLAWKDNASNAANYVVDRSTDQSTWTRLTSTLGATATSYTDNSGLQRATTYYYRVGAVNATNTSAPSFSNVASATTK
ncbi:MAG TPA: fibronectin type III domain-containing protein [Terriglobales bacterium]|nr:fibronectin type III domain-containing protein [Terriglobales bacterium]